MMHVLSYNVHRWYEVGTGRYARTDPLGRRGDPHPFSYVQSRPTYYVDPFGLVTRKKDCGCCTQEDTDKELKQLGYFIQNYWRDYVWTPMRIVRGGSCLTAAEELHDDVERLVAPKCWITSVQLTKTRVISDVFKKVCGVYFPVHYVVKLRPCDGKGADWQLDGYIGPNSEMLPRDRQIDEQ